MNIEGSQWNHSPEGRYHWAFRNESGKWIQKGLLEFPIRCCYPCISLKNRRVDIIAVSDIDEPNTEWMSYKREYAGIAWDYDFRQLYMTFSLDISQHGLVKPILIDSVDDTAGHIKHLDIHVDDESITHVLYIVKNICKPFMRDRFFRGETITATLKVVQIKNGKVISDLIIAVCHEEADGKLWSYGKPVGEKNTGDSFRTNELVPLHGAIHATPHGRLFVIYTLGGYDINGVDLAENYIVEITDGIKTDPVKLSLQNPMKTFFTSPVRIGATPSHWIDMFGIGKNTPNQINYGRIFIQYGHNSG